MASGAGDVVGARDCAARCDACVSPASRHGRNHDGECRPRYQALADVGFTIPAGSSAYWVGEAMSEANYIDLKKTPDKVASNIATLTTNAAHLATILKASNYPAPP